MVPDWISECGTVQLYLGDCLDVLPHLGKVDAVVTDPPYGVGLKGKRAKQRRGGVTVRNDTYAAPDTTEYIKSVVVPSVQLALQMANAGAVTCGIRSLWLYPPAVDMGCFFSAAGTGMGRWGFTCSQPILYYGADPYLREGMGSRPNSCGQTYPNDANEIDHPCAKPIRQWLWLVNRTSLKGETILDPFMGSGTTGVACIRLGREFIGIELEPKYFDIAVERCKKALRDKEGGELFCNKAYLPKPLL